MPFIGPLELPGPAAEPVEPLPMLPLPGEVGLDELGETLPPLLPDEPELLELAVLPDVPLLLELEAPLPLDEPLDAVGPQSALAD